MATTHKTPAQVTVRRIEAIKTRILKACDYAPTKADMKYLYELDDAIYALGFRPMRRTIRKPVARKHNPRTTVFQDIALVGRQVSRWLGW